MQNRIELMAAIDRGIVARIPYTFSAVPEAEAGLRTYLGAPAATRLDEYFGCNRIHSLWDAVGGKPTMPECERRHKTDSTTAQTDIWGVRRELKVVGNASYYEMTHYPLANAETVADVERHLWPSVNDAVLPEVPAGIDLQTWKADKVVLDMSHIGPFGITWSVFGMEKFMEQLYLNPALIEAAVNRIEAYTLARLEKALQKYPGVVDLVGSGDDYGTQQGLMISLEMIRKYFMPSLKRHYDLAARYGVQGYHHSCGAIFDIIPDLIGAGLRVLNPIQTSARGMDPARLKRTFGDCLCFHGGMDIQTVLRQSTPDQVRGEMRRLMDTLGPEGYIAAPSHNIQPDVPPANIVAMYETVHEYGARAPGTAPASSEGKEPVHGR